MVLLALIAAVWLMVAALVVAICRMAARGDAMPAPLVEAGRAHSDTAMYAAHARRSRRQLRRAAHGARLHNVG
jgi:hypothetical protein